LGRRASRSESLGTDSLERLLDEVRDVVVAVRVLAVIIGLDLTLLWVRGVRRSGVGLGGLDRRVLRDLFFVVHPTAATRRCVFETP
jgi:hypothetical protein